MIINHNMAAMNTHRQLGSNNAAAANNIEKLSSGLKINKAGDDAAGLAISEKMRGQIRGLDMAQKNSQDGISMIQTAEGALNETHDILQRMRELATQAANDTNVGVDREEIQKEMNNLSSEINRIGNTTEFNTQALLKGDGKNNLTETGTAKNANLINGATTTVEATQTMTIAKAAAATETAEFTLNGEKITITFAANTTASEGGKSFDVTGNSATVNVDVTSPDATKSAAALAEALKEVISKNENLKGNFTASNSGAALTVEATKTGLAAGAAGNIAATGGTTALVPATGASVGTTVNAKASVTDAVDFSTAPTKDFAGTGFTVGDKQIELYNADKGAYTGNGIGVNISGASTGSQIVKAIVDQAGPQVKDVVFSENASTGKLNITAKEGGPAGNAIRVTDGGVQDKFKANFQVGANKGQSMTIEVADMRSEALGITGKAGADGFSATNNVNNGTNNTSKEAALDVSSHEKATAAIKVINDAIETVSSQRSELGAFQNRLEHTINNLGTSSENLTGAESRIRDVDMAKEMMDFTKNNILTQAAQAMLSQANQAPQGVLQLLR
ncbi:flagellin [Sporosarcina ureae]|uniref:flagellin N-terminal helical domain-containing protein n=1 Tax=Sporosarcina ureae TaxID=1571 RepID=UPI0026ECF4FD|nr:flagellin [Sporosarcina ureae]